MTDPVVLQRIAALGEAGRHAAARTMAEQALATQPDDPDLLLALAWACARLGDLPAALAAVDASRRLRPEDGHAAYLRARVLVALGRGQEALAGADEAARLLPPSAGVLGVRARALALTGDLPTAEATARRAVALAPHSTAALLDLAWSLLPPRRHSTPARLAAAEQAVREALRLEPTDPHLHTELARVLRLRGQIFPAMAAALRALRLGPTSVGPELLDEVVGVVLGWMVCGVLVLYGTALAAGSPRAVHRPYWLLWPLGLAVAALVGWLVRRLQRALGDDARGQLRWLARRQPVMAAMLAVFAVGWLVLMVVPALPASWRAGAAALSLTPVLIVAPYAAWQRRLKRRGRSS